MIGDQYWSEFDDMEFLESGERDLSNGDIGFRVWDLEIGFWLGFGI